MSEPCVTVTVVRRRLWSLLATGDNVMPFGATAVSDEELHSTPYSTPSLSIASGGGHWRGAVGIPLCIPSYCPIFDILHRISS